MTYKLEETKTATNDFKKIKSMSPAVKKRLTSIISELENHPFTGIGSPEQLKHNQLWSRELTKKDRIVYSVEGSMITIYQYLGHYTDK